MTNFEYPLGATPLDPEEIDGLKPVHITTREELNRWEQENIAEAMRWLKVRRRKTEVLNQDFICVLHKKMFGMVWQWAGQFRRRNKNIGVDWPHIPVYLRTLLEDTAYWIRNSAYSSDEIAARFHHRMVYIHPFPNGNGRHARLLTDALLADVLKRDPFTWGSGDLNNSGNVRNDYIAVLKAADDYNYAPLLKFVRS